MSRTFRFKNFTTRTDPELLPEFSAICHSTDPPRTDGEDDVEEALCLASSGGFATAEEADDWMRQHMKETEHRHRHFRRSFEDYAELLPAEDAEPAHAERVTT
ncbi:MULTISPECIES: hypothetical protein [Streptomyces]|uniref:DUF7848 domain-containing protein n=1 Tax=Streptomyces TaxID=1883 RepID=UPI000C26DE80|nr:hypothetical protein [Streptomyces sp. CB02120-2]PJN19258.1 hypothetical protein CG724_10920 [Streptomyces sp. CB02120-2]